MEYRVLMYEDDLSTAGANNLVGGIIVTVYAKDKDELLDESANIWDAWEIGRLSKVYNYDYVNLDSLQYDNEVFANTEQEISDKKKAVLIYKSDSNSPIAAFYFDERYGSQELHEHLWQLKNA